MKPLPSSDSCSHDRGMSNLNIDGSGKRTRSSNTDVSINSHPLGPWKKLRFVSEAYTTQPYNVFKNFMRKTLENYVYVHHKQCMVTPSPRRNKYEHPSGIVVSYNSGHIICVSSDDQVHSNIVKKKDESGNENISSSATPDFSMGCSEQVNDSKTTTNSKAEANVEGQTETADSAVTPKKVLLVRSFSDWIRKKFRSHNIEPTCSESGHLRHLASMGRLDLPGNSVILLEELQEYLSCDFPHWKVLYDPEVAPCMVISRLSSVNTKTPSKSSLLTNNYSCLNENNQTPKNIPTLETSSTSGFESSKNSVESLHVLRQVEDSMFGTAHWPDEEARRKFILQDTLRQADESAQVYLRCVIILSSRRIIVHRGLLEQDLKLAIDDIFPIVRHFFGYKDHSKSSKK